MTRIFSVWFVLFSVLYSGCSSATSRLFEHKSTEESSLNSVTEEIEDSFYLKTGDIETAPISIVTLPESTRKRIRKDPSALDNYKFDLIEVELTSDAVRFMLDTTLIEFKTPAFGETLIIQADDEEHIVGYLEGEPKEQTLEILLPERKGFFDQVKSVLRLLIWLGVLILLGMAGIAIYKWRKGRAMAKGISKVADSVITNILKKFT